MAGYVREEQASCSETRLAKADTDSVKALVKYLEKVYGVVGNYLTYFNDSPKCMFFQDSLMKDLFNFYPDRVCINCSFNNFDIDLYMLIFLCEDSNGRNWTVAVGFMQETDYNSILWLLTTFKKQNPNWRKISSLAVDPEIQHWDLVKEVFPSPIIIISTYHAFRAFKNYVCNADALKMLPQQQKSYALFLFKELLCAVDDSAFETCLQHYQDLPKPFVSYLCEVWWPLKQNWRIPLDFVHEEFFENRNSYLNELNDAIEALSTAECYYVVFIKKIFLMIFLQKREKPSLFLQPVTFLYSRFSPEYQICNTLTPYAAQFVIKQLELSHEIPLSSIPLSDSYTFNHLGMNVQASANSCQCNFFVYTHLPCRHIFCLRRANCLVLFDSSNIDDTWNKQYYDDTSACMQDYFTNSTDSRIPHDLDSRTTLASHLLENTTPLLLGEPQDLFDSRMNVLKNLDRAWKMGDDASVKFIGIKKSTEKKDFPKMFVDSVLFKRKKTVSTSEEGIPAKMQKHQEDKSSVINPCISQEATTLQKAQYSETVDVSSKIQKPEVLVLHEPKRASRLRLCDINDCLLNGKHINLAYIVNRICSSKENCVNWLKSQGFLLTSMKCSSCQGEMTSKQLARLNDGVAWSCLERKCLGKKSSARLGTWFEESNLTLQQMLMFTYMWLNKFSKIKILFEMFISANNYVKLDKFHLQVCEESLNDCSSSVAQAGPSNYRETLDKWLQNHVGKDIFLEFLKDAADVYGKGKLSHDANSQ